LVRTLRAIYEQNTYQIPQVFRNGTSYDRFWEGRRLFQTTTTAIRNCARMIWYSIPEDDDDGSCSQKEQKERAINTLIAFSYAMLHHLRCEWGVREDFAALLPPGFRSSERTMNGEEDGCMSCSKKPHWIREGGMTLPMELIYMLEAYLQEQRARGVLNGAQHGMFANCLNQITDAFGGMERIKSTPVPVCTRIHSAQVLATYCCTLPFCLVHEMGWWMVLVVCLVSFTLYGIEGIGSEIEDPFGTDRNDIKAEAIIAGLHAELLHVVNKIPAHYENGVFGK